MRNFFVLLATTVLVQAVDITPVQEIDNIHEVEEFGETELLWQGDEELNLAQT